MTFSKLKQNISFLNTLDSQGYKDTGENDILKVFKRALIVMKEKLVNGLHHLLDKIIIGNVIVFSSSGLSDRDAIQL